MPEALTIVDATLCAMAGGCCILAVLSVLADRTHGSGTITLAVPPPPPRRDRAAPLYLEDPDV